MGKRFVMFDMDGVLFDSMPLHAKAWCRVMDEMNFHGLDALTIYRNEGRTGKDTIIAFLGEDADYNSIYARKADIFESYGPAPRMAGALEAVKAARDAGAEATVVTGSAQEAMLGRLTTHFPDLFRMDWMVCANDVVHGKPDPEPYLRGLQKSGIPASEAIVVENAPLGVRAGHAAGCYVVAVNTGILPDSDLIEAGADRICHSMFEVAEVLKELIS